MQRTLLAALLLCIAGSSPSAQAPKQQQESPGTTRVAVVNIGRVFQKYGGSSFKSPLEQSLLPYKEKARKITDQIKACELALETKELTPALAEKYRATIAEGKRQLGEMNREIEKILGKRQEENLVAIWKEVQEAIKTYAKQNDIDLVLVYGDPIEKEDLDKFPNVNRKMQAMDLGGTVPLHFAARVDITDGVVKMLYAQKRR